MALAHPDPVLFALLLHHLHCVPVGHGHLLQDLLHGLGVLVPDKQGFKGYLAGLGLGQFQKGLGKGGTIGVEGGKQEIIEKESELREGIEFYEFFEVGFT